MDSNGAYGGPVLLLMKSFLHLIFKNSRNHVCIAYMGLYWGTRGSTLELPRCQVSKAMQQAEAHGAEQVEAKGGKTKQIVVKTPANCG